MMIGARGLASHLDNVRFPSLCWRCQDNDRAFGKEFLTVARITVARHAMNHLRSAVPLLLALVALMTPAIAARAQTTAAPAAALDSCIAAANRKDYVTADGIATANIRLLDDARSRRPADAELLVRTARFIAQCQMPGVEQMRLGELSDQAIDLLSRALAIEPTHWLARY